MIVEDAIKRIDSLLCETVLPYEAVPKMPSGHSVALEHVSYSYDGVKDALTDVSLSIAQGQTVALVGESGGGKTTLANLVARFLILKWARFDWKHGYSQYSERNFDGSGIFCFPK